MSADTDAVRTLITALQGKADVLTANGRPDSHNDVAHSVRQAIDSLRNPTNGVSDISK